MTTPPPGLQHDGARIGRFSFDAASAMLHGPDGTRRLEDRAARTLELLCAARGDVVAQSTILERVWHGRAVSPNSVAVVIGDLRRALGDDARNPALLVTVPKRGYRLNPEPAVAGGSVVADAPEPRVLPQGVRGVVPPVLPQVVPAVLPWAVPPAVPGVFDEALPRGAPPGRATRWSRRRFGVPAGLAAAAAVLLAVLAFGTAQPAPRTLLLRPFVNDTGMAKYDRTARALFELVRLRASHLPGISVATMRDGAAARGGAVLSATLIMWNDMPTLSLTEADGRSGAVMWAAMAEGPEDRLAGSTLARLDELAARR